MLQMVTTNVPELLPDMWGAVARAALAAEGHSPRAWGRLSLVSRAWRDGLRGVLTFYLGYATRARVCCRVPREDRMCCPRSEPTLLIEQSVATRLNMHAILFCGRTAHPGPLHPTLTMQQECCCVPGMPVSVVFREPPFCKAQRRWLRSTAVPLRSITFGDVEARSHVVMEPVSAACIITMLL